MSEKGVKIQLSVAEIYQVVCPKCRKKIRALIKERITDQMVQQVVGGELCEG